MLHIITHNILEERVIFLCSAHTYLWPVLRLRTDLKTSKALEDCFNAIPGYEVRSLKFDPHIWGYWPQWQYVWVHCSVNQHSCTDLLGSLTCIRIILVQNLILKKLLKLNTVFHLFIMNLFSCLYLLVRINI